MVAHIAFIETEDAAKLSAAPVISASSAAVAVSAVAVPAAAPKPEKRKAGTWRERKEIPSTSSAPGPE